jgi:hypothetical protein
VLLADSSFNKVVTNTKGSYISPYIHHKRLQPGLPDGLFSNQKSKFGENLEGLAMEDVGIFYGHLAPFMAFCYILDIWYSSW